jgi:hypothetical protein
MNTTLSADYVTDVLRQYTKTAKWSEELEGKRFSQQALDSMQKDCSEFCEAVKSQLPYLDADPIDLGHDFWLTRNHHGAGFWDGDWSDGSDVLTEIAEAFGESDMYLGDDGLIYVS